MEIDRIHRAAAEAPAVTCSDEETLWRLASAADAAPHGRRGAHYEGSDAVYLFPCLKS